MPQTFLDTGVPAAVMTFNVKNGMNVISWARRRSLLASVIRKERPLLVGTQEAYRYQLTYLQDQLPRYAAIGDTRHSLPEDEYSAILVDTSRVTVGESGTNWLSPTPDVRGSKFEGEHFPRIMTWAICDIHEFDRPLMVANTHLTYESAWIDAQIEVLLAQIERHAPAGIDILLTGDFNSPTHSNAWHTVRAAGFIDAMDFAERVGPLLTAHDWRGVGNPDSRADTLDDRIDWIMYRPGDGVTLPRDCVLETIETRNDRGYPSDHFPVVLRNTTL
ncbi:MAG TPA: endonuclease/exonuclease/phosphatase family protein [Thermomicrobiales bacterium]|nr:endonuclease/exonuclease/phosphatase family protein [Thermomicrobiales bacterium]